MKKILTLLTGIVFLIAILVAVGFTPADDPNNSIEYPEKLTIFLKAVDEGGEMKLLLYDSKDNTQKAAKEHYADVGPGTKVVWRRAKDSNIKSIKKVGSTLEKGPIFPGDATTILFNKRRRIQILDDTPVPGENGEDIEELYEIVFKDKIYKKDWTIDPYLRIEG